jgi:uncharacterized membrane protein
MQSHPDRVIFIDLLRGFAVVVMVIGHSIDSVLSIEVRMSGWFQIYDFFRGFTAPLFLFASGLAFAVATGKRWEEYTHFSVHLRRRLLRVLLLLGIGYALHVPFLSLEKIFTTTPAEAAALFQADVLHCVAVSLLLLHILILVLRSRSRFFGALAFIAPAIVLLTPIVSREDFSSLLSPVISPYLNRQQPSLFPLFPYAGFLVGGVVAGHYFQRSRSDAGTRFLTWFALAGACLATLAVAADLLPVFVLPPHDFWKTSPIFFLLRWAVVAEIVVFFMLLRNIPSTIKHYLTLLGQSSLLVYTVHIMIAYGSSINSGLIQMVGQTLTGPLALLAAASLLTVMLALVSVWHHTETHHRHLSRYIQAGLAGAFLYIFLISPY